MPRVVMYSTEPCGYCRQAKALLERRGIPFEEFNMVKDLEGRMALIERTGMMTFPQILVDDEPIGGFRELVMWDKAGRLKELVAAA